MLAEPARRKRALRVALASLPPVPVAQADGAESGADEACESLKLRGKKFAFGFHGFVSACAPSHSS